MLFTKPGGGAVISHFTGIKEGESKHSSWNLVMGGPLSEWFPPCEGKGGRRIRDQERSTDSGMVSAGEYERNVAESLLIGEEKRETNY